MRHEASLFNSLDLWFSQLHLRDVLGMALPSVCVCVCERPEYPPRSAVVSVSELIKLSG